MSITTHDRLPSHAALMTGPDVWMEGNAIEQLARVAGFDGCARAVGMPDLHAGRGIPIGAAFAFHDTVHPSLVGSDAGCGARLVVAQVKVPSLDALERRVREDFARSPLAEVDASRAFAAVWNHGPRGLAEVPGVPEAMRVLAAREPRLEQLVPSAPVREDDERFAASLGTVGGGNHFAEIARVSEICAAERATGLGLGKNAVVVMAHSGSRGLGKALMDRIGPAPRVGAERAAYLAELAGACRFAAANRFVLTYRLLRVLGVNRPQRSRLVIDRIHNSVSLERHEGRALFVHRKGAAPAPEGEETLVLGSRGAPSWLMLGQGSSACLDTVAHGAGRRMARSEAVAKLSGKYRRTQLTRSKLGGRVICDESEILYAEHPDAYKAIEPVVRAVESAGAATRIAALTPLLTVKI